MDTEEIAMPTLVGIEETRRMLAAGAQLVDVLPEGEYAELHLPGARNIPLKRMTGDAIVVLDRRRPVIVYCHDFQ